MWKKENQEIRTIPPGIEHIIQSITINKDIAIVRVEDVPGAAAPKLVGKPLRTFRYTIVYRKYLDSWLLIASQNNAYCQ